MYLQVQSNTFTDLKTTNPDLSIENFVPALPYSFGKHGAEVVVSYWHTQEIIISYLHTCTYILNYITYGYVYFDISFFMCILW